MSKKTFLDLCGIEWIFFILIILSGGLIHEFVHVLEFYHYGATSVKIICTGNWLAPLMTTGDVFIPPGELLAYSIMGLYYGVVIWITSIYPKIQ